MRDETPVGRAPASPMARPTKPPLLNEKIHAPYKIQALVEVLAAQRIDANESPRPNTPSSTSGFSNVP